MFVSVGAVERGVPKPKPHLHTHSDLAVQSGHSASEEGCAVFSIWPFKASRLVD